MNLYVIIKKSPQSTRETLCGCVGGDRDFYEKFGKKQRNRDDRVEVEREKWRLDR